MTDTKKPRDPALAHLGLGLTNLRMIRGLSQAELAERAGIRSNQISRYETGQVLPQLSQVDRLAQALDIDVVGFFVHVDQVADLVRTVEIGKSDTERLVSYARNLIYDIEGFKRFVGNRLHRILTEGLDRQRFDELARNELARVEVTTDGRDDAPERDAPKEGDDGC